MSKYILSLYFGYHDSNITISSNKEILLHLEAERVFRKKHMRFETKEEMIDFIKKGLNYLELNIDDIKTLYLAKENNKFTEEKIQILGKEFVPILTSHHENHIGTTIPSGFKDALIVCADGGSEDGTTKMYHKQGGIITLLEDLDNTVLTGKFYGTLTQMLINPSFRQAYNFDSGKTMGLASFGVETLEFKKLIDNYSYKINKHYYDNCNSLLKLFNISQNYECPWKDIRRINLAATAQNYWINKFVNKIIEYSNLSENIIITGGCALNVLLNSKIAETKKFKYIYISPVSSDCGQSIGAILFHNPNIKCIYPFLGRNFGNIKNIPGSLFDDLFNNKIIAWYQGSSESGPRALGHRSFLGLPNNINLKKRLSENIKKREPYRPVAPIIADKYIEQFFNCNYKSEYMTFAPKAKKKTLLMAPSIVHVDNTSRVQTLSQKANPVLYEVLMGILKKIGIPIIMNTSFNIMGEPIVDTPEDAHKTFIQSGADVLYINGKRYLN